MTGNYSLTAIFTKEPVVIAEAVRTVLWVLVLVDVVFLDEKQLAAIGLVLSLVLGLFVHKASTPVAEPTLPKGTDVTVVTPGPTPNETVTV